MIEPRFTGLTDYKGQQIFEGDFVFVPRRMGSNPPFVGQVEYDSARYRVRCQAPFNTCGTVDLAAYIVNVNPLITPPAYKVTDPEFIKNHKMDI